MSALEGRTALVTGAGRGIGLAITQRLLADGARVAMVDRDAPAVEGAAKRLGAAARPIVADVTRTADVNAAVTAAHDWHGRLDIVVNNAGITGRSFPTWELTDALARRTRASVLSCNGVSKERLLNGRSRGRACRRTRASLPCIPVKSASGTGPNSAASEATG